MSLSVNESMDLNTVLSYLLAIERGSVPPPDPESARSAALRLTVKAHTILGAGLMPHQVNDAWPLPNGRKKGAAR